MHTDFKNEKKWENIADPVKVVFLKVFDKFIIIDVLILAK